MTPNQSDALSPDALAKMSSDEKRELLAMLLREKSQDRESVYPLSYGQRGLWYLHENDPTRTVCNLALPLRIRSPLDTDALRKTFQLLMERHPSLRTAVEHRDGQLVQRVHADPSLPLEFIDANGWSDDRLKERLEHEAHRPFDLRRGPLWRLLLFTRRPDDHFFIAVVHHIIGDFWSLVVVLSDFHSTYAALHVGKSANLSPLPTTYRDFVEEQFAMLKSPVGESLWSKWQDQLRDLPHVLELPTDYARRPAFTHRGAMHVARFSKTLTERLIALADTEEVTLFTVLLAGFQVLLARHARQEQFIVGSPFSGRGHANCENVVGYFINMLPMRADLTGNPTFRDLLHRVSETVLHALENEQLPFNLLVEKLNVRRDPSRQSLIQVSFTLEKSHRGGESQGERYLLSQGKAERGPGNLLVEPYHIDQRTCQGDLELLIQRWEGGMEATYRYARDLFDADTIERLAERFETLLEDVSADPKRPISDLKWYSELERRQAVINWNQTQIDFPHDICLHQLVEQQAARTPDNIAISMGDEKWTYSELDAHSNRMAKRLTQIGVGLEHRVVVMTDRSPEMIVGLLAVLKAGGAFVPLDPASPPDRLRRILQDAEPHAILAQKSYENLWYPDDAKLLVIDDPNADWRDESDSPPECSVAPTNLAYVIYTSGSTGQPKGVMVEHRAICNTVQWRRRALPVEDTDRVLVAVPHFFDASLCLIFPTLASGGRIVLAPPGDAMQPNQLLQQIERERVTVLPLPFGLLRALIDLPEFTQACRNVRMMYTGGEPMPTEFARRLCDSIDAPFFNLYGPTETAVEATYWQFDRETKKSNLPIGKPIANTQAYVLDDERRPLPVGIPGELYIGGVGLARGYLNDEQLTSNRFVPNPFSPSKSDRLFCTGDRCRWLADGTLEFLGRIDHQVKVRGYRTEIGEIESALMQHDAIREAAVTTFSRNGETQLLAFVAFNENAIPTDMIRHFLKNKLPGYMIPVRIETLAEIPKTSTGKIDRKALPDPSEMTSRRNRTFVAPRSPLEHFLADIWCDMLDIDQVSVEDNFFELGGDSIQTTMVVSRIKEKLGEHLHTAALFDSPNIASLAGYLERTFPETIAEVFGEYSQAYESNSDVDESSELLVPLQTQGNLPPLFMVHPPGGIVVCYQPLAYHMGTDRPVYAIRARGIQGDDALPECLEEMAADYIAAIRTVRPNGPIHLGGWSLGGVIAYEMAQQIRSQSNDMGALAFLDTTIPFGQANEMYTQETDESGLEYGLDLTFEQLTALTADEQLPLLWEHARKLAVVSEDAPLSEAEAILNDLKQLFHSHIQLASEYALQPYAGRITMFRPTDVPTQVPIAADRGWGQLAEGVDVFYVPGQHHTMVREPGVKDLAEQLRICLWRAD